MTNEPKFNTLSGRKRNEDELDRLVEEWTSQRPPEEVVTLMQAAGVGAGLVANVGDLYEDPQFKHYHCFQEFDHSVLGKLSFYIPPGFTLFKASY